MPRKTTIGFAAALASAALLAAPVLASAESTTSVRGDASTNALLAGPQAIGLTDDQQLVRFNVGRVARAVAIGTVSGLSGDTKLIGIDYRVQDGLLYGVGDLGGVYSIDTGTAVGSKVSQLTTLPSGTNFGVDFNPAADRLRVISDNGQNLRHDITGGVTTVDVTLTYPPATTPAPGLTAAAYTNNDLDTTTGTSLYDIDTTLNQVALQSPANNGTLASTGLLGVDADADAGFDILSQLRNGKTTSVQGFATLAVGGSYRLYTINIITGEAVARGAFPSSLQVTDLAVSLQG